MEDTEQFNIRLSKSLLYDLEFISQSININRNDWIRLELAKIIADTKDKIIEKFEIKYVNGFLSDEEFKNSTGIFPTQGIKELREKQIKLIQSYPVIFEQYSKKVLEELKDKKNPLYYDKYMKKIINKVELKRKN